LCPAIYFVLHAPEFCLPIRSTRIDHGPDTKGRRTLERVSAQVCTRLQSSHGLQQPEYVQVEDRLGVRMIPGSWRITSHAYQIAHPQRCGRQQVGLQGEPVAIAAGDLEHRFQASLYQKTRYG
jgi:hypothetical protein